ncbi:MAG: protein translocase subunit SecF [Deferribacterales bacterium]
MFELIKQGTQFDFMGKAKLFFLISGVLVLLSLGMIFTKGFNFGIDFAGGTIVQVKFEQAPDLNTIRKAMDELKIGETIIQNFGSPEEILIRVVKNDKELKSVSDSIQASLQENVKGNTFIVERVEQVGPQVGSELKKMAVYAILYSLIGILIYVAFRFQLVFSLGAVMALFHDVIITLGFFSLLGKEISISVVAAVLTLVGYSLNDTIVVFDRIRENMREDKAKSMNLKDVMNLSLNETLSRTILTSFLTLLTVVALYFFGGEVINGFAFTLLIGILVGTYSSIGIASALVYLIKKDK